MKATITDYMINVSKSKIESNILEDIISKKYRKFIKFYWLLKQHSENIEELKYCCSDDDTLEISIILKNKSESKEMMKSLKKTEKKNDFDISVKKSGDEIFIMLKKDESDLP